MSQERNVPPGIPTGWTGSRRSSYRKCVHRKGQHLAKERNGSGEWSIFFFKPPPPQNKINDLKKKISLLAPTLNAA